jgi:inosose dehydratase
MRDQRIAVNPLPWVVTPNGFELNEAVIAAAMGDLATAGYSALHADIPAGMTTDRYRSLLADHGFQPAPGYFSGAFHDREQHDGIVEQARQHAARMAELGLTETFVAADLTPERIAAPAVGTGESSERTAVVAEGLARAADAAASEGVRQALHPHVGSSIETPTEVEAILTATAGSALGFGPDVGHLAWAGADPAALIRQHADRVLALHLKDFDGSAATAARHARSDYWTATTQQHVWTEPGRGDVDFDAVFAALPAEFAGWFVVEVDVPNIPDRVESSRVALQAILTRPYFIGEHA